MVEAKHEFIDDNPYLVYSPDAEATASGSGGGGNVAYVSMIEGALNVKAGELYEMVQNQPVFVIWHDGETQGGIGYICEFNNAGESGYHFSLSTPGQEAIEFFDLAAATADDYPTAGN